MDGFIIVVAMSKLSLQCCFLPFDERKREKRQTDSAQH